MISPAQSKREEDIINDLERWKREVREVETADESDGGEGKLPYTYKLSALKKLLTGRIQEQVRFKEVDADLDAVPLAENEVLFIPRSVLVNRYILFYNDVYLPLDIAQILPMGDS